MKYIIVTALLSLPSFVAAQPNAPRENFGYVGGFFNAAKDFIDNILIPLVFTVALLMFLFGMYRWFIQGGASEEDRKKGQQLALWAIIGFVLMVSIWGIVTAISVGLFGTTTAVPDVPGTPSIR